MTLFSGVSNLGDKLGRAAQGDPMAIVAVIGGSILAGIVVMILYFFLRRKATRIARGIGGCQCKCSIFGIFCKRVFTITGEKHDVKFEIAAIRAEGGFPTTFFSFNKPLAITWENIRADLSDSMLAAVKNAISVDSTRRTYVRARRSIRNSSSYFWKRSLEVSKTTPPPKAELIFSKLLNL